VTEHPYVSYERTPAWEIIDAALAELEANSDLAITTARPYVIGYLCQQLAELGPEISEPILAIWRVLRTVRWLEDTTKARQIELAGALAQIAESGTADHVALFLRDRASKISGTPAQPIESFLPLAHQIVRAYSSEAG
jgi:hypothetical protein